jgi:hypothetical protein
MDGWMGAACVVTLGAGPDESAAVLNDAMGESDVDIVRLGKFQRRAEEALLPG